jgi:hypothetical protein
MRSHSNAYISLIAATFSQLFIGCWFQEQCEEWVNDEKIHVISNVEVSSINSELEFVPYGYGYKNRYSTAGKDISMDSVNVAIGAQGDSIQLGFRIYNGVDLIILADTAKIDCDTNGVYDSWHKSGEFDIRSGKLNVCGYYVEIDCP